MPKILQKENEDVEVCKKEQIAPIADDVIPHEDDDWYPHEDDGWYNQINILFENDKSFNYDEGRFERLLIDSYTSLPRTDIILGDLFGAAGIPRDVRAKAEPLILAVLDLASRRPDALETCAAAFARLAEGERAPSQSAPIVPRSSMLPKAPEALATRPTELWAERANKRENPAAFIRRVYAAELQAGTLTRAFLKIDPPLYQAYASWIRPGRHPEDDLGLATEPRVKAHSAEEYMERRRAQVRAAVSRVRSGMALARQSRN